MAASYGHSLGRGTSGGDSRLEQALLPNGACGYRDLTAGARAPTCGCRRFWLDTGHVISRGDERAWCFCGHHACFHDHVSVPTTNGYHFVPPVDARPNTYTTHPRANAYSQRGALMPPTWSELIGEHANPGQENEAAPVEVTAPTGLGIQENRGQRGSQSINARLWEALNGFARSQDDEAASGDTSKLPSTAVPSVYEEPSAETPTQVLPHQRRTLRNMGPPVTIPVNHAIANRTEEDYSATEVATPSVRGTPDPRALAAHTPVPPSSQLQATHDPSPLRHAMLRSAQPSILAQPTPPPTASVGPSLSVQEMCNTIQDYGRRISFLESVSFSHMPSQEILDKFEILDGRVLDLEHWHTEQDKAQSCDDIDERLQQAGGRLDDLEQWRSEHQRARASQRSDVHEEPSATRGHHGLCIDSGSFASDGSFDENAAAQTETVVLAALAANAETRPRIDALESRITDLENAALPSSARPWHVQVVLLPFGRQLPGIWFSASESTQQSLRSATQASEEWDGPRAALKASFQSTASSGWTTESIEAWNHGVEQEEEWLSPKACGPSGTVFQRLASRGLVRDVVLHAPDAHHICNAISSAFGTLLNTRETESSHFNGRFQGLRESFIPLRKVRKSSRLRFLSPSEMITSALWDAGFLESSVFMRVNDGQRRLYLTTTAGYTQPQEHCWSWPSLRDLPAFGIDGELQAAQMVGNFIEACWTHNHRLDHASSGPSSFRSDGSPWGSSSDDGIFEGKDNREGVTMLSPSTTRHSHMRSLSLPSSASLPVLDIESAPKRRVASFELEPNISTLEYSSANVAKRRRISTSPELERRGVNFTPRWSREPPSPYTADDAAMFRNSQAASSRQRGTTPFAYATPHSHMESTHGDGDTEIAESDVPSGQNHQADDLVEWEGVEDGPHGSPTHPNPGDEAGIEDHLDEENLDDGLTIYGV